MSTLIILSFVASSNIFQNQLYVANGQHSQISLSNNSHYDTENDISNTLLEKFKEIVFNSTAINNSSSSSLNNIDGSKMDSSIPIVVGIVSPNGTQVSGYGNISNFNSTIVDGNTVFDIASISKTFVAIILADMVDQGLVNLNDPIEKYLHSDKVIVPSYDGHKITLEHLATHTSGLPDFPTGWIRNHSYTTQQVYDFVSNTTLESKPGTKADYSDIGMGILGHILSLKAGVSFDQLVKDKILNVVAMKSTGMRMNTTSVSVPEEIKYRYAVGHIAGNEVNLEFVPETIQSAGAMYSTINDLLKYLSANIGLIQTKLDGAIEETHLIRHSFGQSSDNKSLKDYIGLGWTVTTDFGSEVIWHTGSIDGYTSVIGFNPSKQIGLAILCGCNYDDYSLRDMINLVIPFLIYYR
ncbi:serine hydrolase domain-containing protein [Candidatus Nitrosocosmicus hydrocola]|uniref:serine hydrolase domain-containing protein n=1 Tax=Candidatus Nitrosocosmicus hydrocola TaxID=1826872 RepID=UPI0011E5F63F|nr:serine hydrolase domain-containing protein [Candidatus Nitrosocosmicus hydrocola]